MSAIAELVLPDPILFEATFQAVPSAETRFEDIHYVRTGPDAIQYIFFAWTTGCDFDEFEAAVAADPTVAEWARLVEFDDRRLYRIVTSAHSPSEEPLVFPLYRKHDITALETRRTASGLDLRVRVPSRDALRAFERDLADRGTSLEVGKIVPEDRTGTSDHDLTEKQREALAIAVDRGYFETPKAVTLEELAGEFGATPQTLSRHLRVAVETLVEQAVDSMPDVSIEAESA